MTFCAISAYAFAEYVQGHTGPLFAAPSSLIALGFSREARLRRVLEVGIGCTLGIVVGDLLLSWLGSGIWQAALVLFISIMLARFLDGGVILTTQLALQSVLVMLLPAPVGDQRHPDAARFDADVAEVLERGGEGFPVFRHHRGEVGEPSQTLGFVDLALRNSRFFDRRLTSAINNAALSDDGPSTYRRC